MKNIDSIKDNIISSESLEGGWSNFVVEISEDRLGIVFTKKMEDGWEFVSVRTIDEASLLSAFFRQKIYHASWDETCFIRNMFFESDEPVVEFIPKESSFLNETTLCLFSNKKIEVPNNEIIKASSKKITLPNKKLINLRRNIEGNWERFNLRLLNKKQNILKRYLDYEDMLSFKEQNLPNDNCAYFVFSDLNSDYSVDLYRPVDGVLDMPLSVFDEVDSLMDNISYDEIVKQVAQLNEEFSKMISDMPEIYEGISNLLSGINVDVKVKTITKYKSIN